MTQPSVSIVINTYSRAASLEKALSAACNLAYSNFEIIVVNGPSSDHTAEVIQHWGGRIKGLTCPEVNLSMSRNIGIEAAAGEIVAFIDDDAAPHPLWLARLVSAYLDPRVGGAGGFTLDRSGARFQVRKTICDRYGNAYFVSPLFDERLLNFPQTPFYPSLLGTNSSFRRAALQQINGFDHGFAYLLDETDVCLRLVDAGWRIEYVPDALVQHRFESSHLRDERRVAKSLYPSASSKAYFVMRHGRLQGLEDAAREINSYRDSLIASNAWLEKSGLIGADHRFSLDQDIAHGLRDGTARSIQRATKLKGDMRIQGLRAPEDFTPIMRLTGSLRIAFVSQCYPPDTEAGIARWTQTLAQALSRRGHAVHVISRGADGFSMSFEEGVWIHRIVADASGGEALALERNLPSSLCAWPAAVKREIDRIKPYGLDVVSHPIWDLEGLGLLDDPDLVLALSLHTTYALAKPFKPEWNARPLYEHFFVNRVIEAERVMLESAPIMLANSYSIIKDITAAYGMNPGERALHAPHGTPDPFLTKPQRRELRGHQPRPFRAIYVGRFEERKGFDIALKSMCALLNAQPGVEVVFAGATLDVRALMELHKAGADALLQDSRVQFVGILSREALDDLYAEADVLLAPSRYESFGLVAIEAFAAGTPVIALDVAGLAEVVETGRSGFLVSPGLCAADECATRLIELARDARLQAKLAVGARATFESRYTVEAMATAAEQAYGSAVALGTVKKV